MNDGVSYGEFEALAREVRKLACEVERLSEKCAHTEDVGAALFLYSFGVASMIKDNEEDRDLLLRDLSHALKDWTALDKTVAADIVRKAVDMLDASEPDD